jgi:hypothetical protein
VNFNYTLRMSRPFRILSHVFLAVFTLSCLGCKTTYSRMYSPKKIHFSPPAEKKSDTELLPPPSPAGAGEQPLGLPTLPSVPGFDAAPAAPGLEPAPAIPGLEPAPAMDQLNPAPAIPGL